MPNSSLQQAAVILKSLPKAQAAKILSRLEAVDIKTVFEALEEVDQVQAHQIESAVSQFEDSTSQINTNRSVQGRIVESRQTVSSKTESPDDSKYRPFNFLHAVAPAIRHQLLKDEHPRNISLVLAQLEPQTASQIVHQLDPALKISVLRRLCESNTWSQEEAAQLSYALKLRLKKIERQSTEQRQGVDIAADLLSVTDSETVKDVLDYLVQQDPDLARRLEEAVFSFSDLTKLSDAEIQSLLKIADTSAWAPALKFASLETRNKILKNMAKRPAQMLSHEISEIGPIDRHTSEQAQQTIINLVLRMRRKADMHNA